MPAKRIQSIEEARAIYEKSLIDGLNRLDIDREVRNSIQRVIDGREHIILSIMGIQVGSWETKFRKDRDTSPELFEQLKQKLTSQAQKVLSEMKDLDFKVSATLKTRLESAYRVALSETLIELVREAGRKEAQVMFESMQLKHD